MKKKAKAGLASKNLLQKVELGRRLVTHCTGNANFTTPNPALASITTASDNAEDAFNAAQGGGVEETALKDAAETALDTIIAAFAAYVDSIAKGSETIVLSSGFEATKDPQPAGDTPQVKGLEASNTQKKGESLVRFNPLKKVRAFILERSDTPDDGGFVQIAILTKSRFLVTGLESLRYYWYRVRAIGSGGKLGPYSDPAQGVAL